jgi:hypothetical protein
MGDLEEGILLSSLIQPLSWFQFIDDVGMKWIHSDKELNEFFEKQCLGWQLLGERY